VRWWLAAGVTGVGAVAAVKAALTATVACW
jgi:hypothetical protein